MIQVIQEIYNLLSGDATLISKLADDGLGNPAIYDTWGIRESGPYIVLTYLQSSETAYHQATQELQIDIFDRGDEQGVSYVRCYEVRNELVRLLDGFKSNTGTLNIRSFWNGEGPTAEDDGRVRRYTLSFEIRFNRTFDVQ